MSEVYIIQNQDKLFLGKQRTWLDGRDPAALYRSPHKDEAVNEKFEINAKDYTQRVKLVACGLNERGQPAIDPDILPPPLPKEKETQPLDLDDATAAPDPEAPPATASEATH
ncbi:hypothetical protein [Gilvimarinus chinensis]|uniref:hypothetical protein n=1 Tax=Gilvimarinus chinensis TaxID=396005 RepID=UPI000371C90C|nr:hypothetical protein [Gilvimarinus chinensis]